MRFAVGGKERTQEVGVEITPEALAAKLVRDRIFYEETGGGVTFSGGEAVPEFSEYWTASLIKLRY